MESGKFSPYTVTEWNARAAYAACLLPDATDSVVAALKKASDLYAFSECLYNSAPIRTPEVAQAVIHHIDNHLTYFRCSESYGHVTTEMKEDFFGLVSDELLYSLLLAGIKTRRRSGDIVTSFSLAEMLKRGKRFSPQILNQLRIAYPIPDLTFHVKRPIELTEFKLTDLVQQKDNNNITFGYDI